MTSWGLLLQNWLLPLLAGACVGSFLNVCIYRVPLGRSIVMPGSHCATCGAPIQWWFNVPVMSWFVLRGKAGCCGTKIDFRYVVVEVLTAVLFLMLWQKYLTAPWLALIFIVFTCGLIVATFIDLDHFIIPDRITMGSCLLGLFVALLYPQLHHTDSVLHGFLRSLYGMLTGGIVLMLVSIIGRIIFRQEAMGMGDVKLLAGMGAFLGWQSIPFIIAVSSLVGSVFGIVLLLMKGRRWGLRMPFGPYLAVAAIIWILGGNHWMKLYFDYLAGQ